MSSTTAQPLSAPAPHARSRAPRRDRITAWVPASIEAWAVMGLIVLAAIVRILAIDNQSLWMDESLTAYEAGLPFGAMLHVVQQVETTPPLFFVLEWGWAKLFGTGEVALRTISMLAGVSLVPIAYLCARELASRWAGVIAAALVAVNPFLIWYSQEARSYMLLAVLSGASFLWFVRARVDPSRRNLIGWAVPSALALTTHFFAGFLIAPEVLWLLWCQRRRAVLVAAGVVAAVQAAMLPFAVADTGHGADWIAHVPRLYRIASTAMEWGVSELSRHGNVLDAFIGTAVLLGAVTALVLLGGDRLTRRAGLVAGGVAGFAILAPIVLALLGQDYIYPRNLIPAFVPVVAVIAAACAAPRARVPGALLAVALLTMFCAAGAYVQTHPYLERPEWRDLARVLGRAPVTRAVIAADGATADPLKIYLPGVRWVQPQGRDSVIREIDVVGARKKLAQAPLAPPDAATGTQHAALPLRKLPKVSALPVRIAPRGTRLISRIHVHNWVVARFRLDHPRRLTITQLIRMAHLFFGHAPRDILIFIQHRRR